MTEPLFIPDVGAPDPAYVNIRDGEPEPAKAARELTEALWQRYAPYADRHFCTEIQAAFDERFWEMCLTCALLDLDLPVSCPKPGPDVLVRLKEATVWIEAICPTQGAEENPDRVIERKKGAEVETDIFFQDKYRSLSAVLYSRVNACNPTERLGDDFVLIHNPRAAVPLPDGGTPRGREYRVREDNDVFSLETTDHA